MSRTIKDVPIKHVLPTEDYVLVQQYDANMSAGGLHLPERAKVVVHVARKVGSNVKNVKEGDLVILGTDRAAVAVHEVSGPAALVPGDAIAGVIRGFDWETALKDEATSPLLVS